MSTKDLAVTAINTKQTLYFTYDDKSRIVEVHAVGNTHLRGYQVAGQSSRPLPCWALFTLDKCEGPSLSFFPLSEAPRPGYKLNDKQIPDIVAQVELIDE
jgi:hypothetical protein